MLNGYKEALKKFQKDYDLTITQKTKKSVASATLFLVSMERVKGIEPS